MKHLPRAELVLPLVIVLAAVMLGVSEFMATFQLTPPGGEPLRELAASDRHHYALLLLAIFIGASTMFAVATGLRVAAYATAALCVAALLLFLILDLPDAGQLGDLDDPTFSLSTARVEPQTGFWLEAVASVVLALAGAAFATLSSEQLRAPLGWLTSDREHSPAEPRRRRQRRPKTQPPFDFQAEDGKAGDDGNSKPGRLRRLRSR